MTLDFASRVLPRFGSAGLFAAACLLVLSGPAWAIGGVDLLSPALLVFNLFLPILYVLAGGWMRLIAGLGVVIALVAAGLLAFGVLLAYGLNIGIDVYTEMVGTWQRTFFLSAVLIGVAALLTSGSFLQRTLPISVAILNVGLFVLPVFGEVYPAFLAAVGAGWAGLAYTLWRLAR